MNPDLPALKEGLNKLVKIVNSVDASDTGKEREVRLLKELDVERTCLTSASCFVCESGFYFLEYTKFINEEGSNSLTSFSEPSLTRLPREAFFFLFTGLLIWATRSLDQIKLVPLGCLFFDSTTFVKVLSDEEAEGGLSGKINNATFEIHSLVHNEDSLEDLNELSKGSPGEGDQDQWLEKRRRVKRGSSERRKKERVLMMEAQSLALKKTWLVMIDSIVSNLATLPFHSSSNTNSLSHGSALVLNSANTYVPSSSSSSSSSGSSLISSTANTSSSSTVTNSSPTFTEKEKEKEKDKSAVSLTSSGPRSMSPPPVPSGEESLGISKRRRSATVRSSWAPGSKEFFQWKNSSSSTSSSLTITTHTSNGSGSIPPVPPISPPVTSSGSYGGGNSNSNPSSSSTTSPSGPVSPRYSRSKKHSISFTHHLPNKQKGFFFNPLSEKEKEKEKDKDKDKDKQKDRPISLSTLFGFMNTGGSSSGASFKESPPFNQTQIQGRGQVQAQSSTIALTSGGSGTSSNERPIDMRRVRASTGGSGSLPLPIPNPNRLAHSVFDVGRSSSPSPSASDSKQSQPASTPDPEMIAGSKEGAESPLGTPPESPDLMFGLGLANMSPDHIGYFASEPDLHAHNMSNVGETRLHPYDCLTTRGQLTDSTNQPDNQEEPGNQCKAQASPRMDVLKENGLLVSKDLDKKKYQIPGDMSESTEPLNSHEQKDLPSITVTIPHVDHLTSAITSLLESGRKETKIEKDPVVFQSYLLQNEPPEGDPSVSYESVEDLQRKVSDITLPAEDFLSIPFVDGDDNHVTIVQTNLPERNEFSVTDYEHQHLDHNELDSKNISEFTTTALQTPAIKFSQTTSRQFLKETEAETETTIATYGDESSNVIGATGLEGTEGEEGHFTGKKLRSEHIAKLVAVFSPPPPTPPEGPLSPYSSLPSTSAFSNSGGVPQTNLAPASTQAATDKSEVQQYWNLFGLVKKLEARVDLLERENKKLKSDNQSFASQITLISSQLNSIQKIISVPSVPENSSSPAPEKS
eukprot:TRINITY_DN68_c6_g1_i1.p1 TRINITY_DN68_c6_g1~~TRINITY_DN68_c6_g1_i1.p1  ORF type:complete len:1074 (+),score=236.72 TRINITY_DN68_c6_g1_i1:134-3223(+)